MVVVDRDFRNQRFLKLSPRTRHIFATREEEQKESKRKGVRLREILLGIGITKMALLAAFFDT